MGTGNLWFSCIVMSRVSRHIDIYRDVGWSRWTPPRRRRPAVGAYYMNLFVVALARAFEVLLDVLGQLEHLEPLHPE